MRRIPLIDHLVRLFPSEGKKELYSRILCGEVKIDGEKVLDPRRPVSTEAGVEFVHDPYVSRGGLKLEHAIARWDLQVRGKIFLDAGASTGGFTDCLLQHGASMVYAVDVGYNQLDYTLRTNTRVKVMERTNIMSVDGLDPVPHAAVADLSFRSLRKAASHIVSLTSGRTLVALMKPQFEYRPTRDHPSARRQQPELSNEEDVFSGVITDPQLVYRVLLSAVQDISAEGLRLGKISASPIRGRRGNREFLLLLYGPGPEEQGGHPGRIHEAAEKEHVAEEHVQEDSEEDLREKILAAVRGAPG